MVDGSHEIDAGGFAASARIMFGNVETSTPRRKNDQAARRVSFRGNGKAPRGCRLP